MVRAVEWVVANRGRLGIRVLHLPLAAPAMPVLFEDPLDGTPREGWRVPPDHFVDHPEHGTVYLLEPGEGGTIETPPWVGDETWGAYRIEFEVATTGQKDGWVGPDFHVQDDGLSFNVSFRLL